jgi:hypothetical protein
MKEIYEAYVKRFEERFDEELEGGKIGEYHCLRILRELAEALERQGESLEDRRRILNTLTLEMAAYVDSRAGAQAKRVYERWRAEAPLDRESFGKAREELLHFDRCYRNAYEELERFDSMEGERLLSRETVHRVRDDLVRFEQLIQTYIRLLELQIPSDGATGA